MSPCGVTRPEWASTVVLKWQEERHEISALTCHRLSLVHSWALAISSPHCCRLVLVMSFAYRLSLVHSWASAISSPHCCWLVLVMPSAYRLSLVHSWASTISSPHCCWLVPVMPSAYRLSLVHSWASAISSLHCCWLVLIVPFVLVKPNGRVPYSNNPYSHIKVVLGISSGAIGIWW